MSGADHEQGFGQKERHQEAAGQDIEGKEIGQAREEADQGIVSGAHKTIAVAAAPQRRRGDRF
jgi:hypothetical protein